MLDLDGQNILSRIKFYMNGLWNERARLTKCVQKAQLNYTKTKETSDILQDYSGILTKDRLIDS